MNIYMPVEWLPYFTQAADPYDEPEDQFATEFINWIGDNPHLEFTHVDSSRTVIHGYPSHRFHWWRQEMVCYQYTFYDHSDGRSDRSVQVPRHLRISVPAPTKLPLP